MKGIESHSLTIGIYNGTTPSGIYYLNNINNRYDIIVHYRNSKHATETINYLKEEKGILICNDNKDSNLFNKLNDNIKYTNNIKFLIERSDLIILAIPSILHEDAIKKLIKQGIVNKKIPIILTPGRTIPSLYLWELLPNNYPIVSLSTLPVICRQLDKNKYFLKKKSIYSISLEGNFSDKNISDLYKIFPKEFITNIPALTSLNNIGSILHPAPYILNIDKIEKKLGCFYRDCIISSKSTQKIIKEIDNVRLNIANKLNLPIDKRPYTNSILSLEKWLILSYDIPYDIGDELEQILKKSDFYLNINPKKRYVEEEIPTGLVPLESLGKIFNIDVSSISNIIDLYDKYNNKNSRRDGRNLNKFNTKKIINYLLLGKV